MKNHVRELYKCPKCHLTVEIASACSCEEPCLRCCGEKLAPVTVNSADAAGEKHLPQVRRSESLLSVQIGSVEHPMSEAHHIVWIEVTAGDWCLRKYLKAGAAPAADFKLCCNKDEKVMVRAYCNVHGLWQCEA